MRPTAATGARAMFAGIVAAAAAWLGGCAGPPAPTAPAVRAVPAANVEVPFEQAAAQATDALVDQARTLPGLGSSQLRRSIVLDPMLDATSGQQTATTQALEQRVRARTAIALPGVEVLPLASNHLAGAKYLLTGTLTRGFANRRKGSLMLNLALTELSSGSVVAQSWALTRDDGLDNTPLPSYADSPVLLKDRVTEGYITTSATGAGKRADAYYLERINAAKVINDANALYNAQRYAEALAQYRAAAAVPGGDQLRVLAGIYLTNAKLGRGTEAEAELAFGRLAAHGIATRQLGVKFLFNPGSTVLWSDPRVSDPYPMWLRRIARESTAAKVCMDIVGHTSRTGSEAFNDTLSLQRAALIRQRLTAESAVLGGRTRPVGMGYRQNIVGSGTDNAVDALDRRVEFKIVPCT